MEKRTESQRVRDAAGKDGDADFGTMGEGGQFKNMSLDMATLTAKEAELQQFTTIDKIQSVRYYDLKVELEPENWQAYFERGEWYDEDGQFRKALADYSRAICLEPRQFELYYARSFVYDNLNKPIEARQDRLKALGLLELEFDPAEGWHYIKRGALYMDTGRSQEAWIEYAKGYEILPDDNKSSIVGHCRWRGEVYGEAGEYDIAMKYYDLASEALLFARNTQNETMVSQEMFFSSLLLSARGELYCAMGNYDAAYAYFSRYAEIYENRNQSNSPDSYSLAWAEMDAWSIYADRAGVILAKSDAGEAILPEEWKSALMDCNHAIVLHSRKYKTYFIRGRIFEKLNKLDEARVDFSKAIEISPDESAAYLLCGVVCEAQGDIDRAIDDYTRAIGLDPENENAYTLRGSLYEKIGRLEEALGDYAQAIELDPDNPEVRKDYGNLCALLTRENGDED